MARTTERGYGWTHQQERARWAPLVDAGMVTCWRCGRRIQPGSGWDLGHADDRAAYEGPEHPTCNRSAGAKRAQRQTRKRVTERHPGLL